MFGCAAWNVDGNDGTDPTRNFLGTTDSQPLVIKTNNIDAVVVDAGGNLGVGTRTPARKLQVNSGSDHISARFDSDTVASAIAFRNSAVDSDSVMVDAKGETLGLVTGAADRVVIREDGNAGVGTLTPDAKLEVGGQVKITGGNPGAGRVLRSDADGLASWQAPFVVAVRTSEFDIAPHSLRETGVACQDDEIATGGGVR